MKGLLKKVFGKRGKVEKRVADIPTTDVCDEYFDTILKTMDSMNEDLKKRNDDLRNRINKLKELNDRLERAE